MNDTIDLSDVRAAMTRAESLIEMLHGQPLDESAAITSQSKGRARAERARLSQALQRLGHELDMAAGFARDEYWAARDGRIAGKADVR